MPINLKLGLPGADLIDLAALVPLFPGDPWDVAAVGGNDTVLTVATDTTPDTVAGGDGDDVIVGNKGANLLIGDNAGGGGIPGHDSIQGGDEVGGLGDIIQGGAGNDKLDGQGGSDSVDGGDGRDLVYGGDGNDLLSGGAAADKLSGGNGDDEMHGGTGADRMAGDNGADSLDGGTENDTLQGGKGDDLLNGDVHNDSLLGGAGNDSIFGGGDEDRLAGGKGRDVLTGGAGLDRFIYFNPNEGGDTITDFIGAGGDLIVLSKSGFGLASAVGGALAAAELGFFGAFAAADAAAQPIGLVNSGGTIFLTYNASAAAGDLVRLAMFTGAFPAGPADFEIIA